MIKRYKFLRPIFPVFYKETEGLSLLQRSFSQYQNPRELEDQKAREKDQLKKQKSLKTEEDDDEFFDALDEIMPEDNQTEVNSEAGHSQE